ncbi:MAG: hypothetical protein ACC645_17695, partial [Pirellulales bacterium]
SFLAIQTNPALAYLAKKDSTPWSTVFSSDGHQVAMTRGHDDVRQGAIFAVPTDAEDGTSITVSHKIPSQAVRLVAVDRTNRVHLASSAVGGGAIGFTQKTYRFADAVPDSIQRYELQSQTRQFDTIEFRNVSLHADKQSRVEIVRVAAGDAGQPQGARGGVLAEPVTGPQNRRELKRAVRQALEKDNRYRLAAGELVKHEAPAWPVVVKRNTQR